jgi:hypothetical protein
MEFGQHVESREDTDKALGQRLLPESCHLFLAFQRPTLLRASQKGKGQAQRTGESGSVEFFKSEDTFNSTVLLGL